LLHQLGHRQLKEGIEQRKQAAHERIFSQRRFVHRLCHQFAEFPRIMLSG
jgi:hypothetical protein